MIAIALASESFSKIIIKYYPLLHGQIEKIIAIIIVILTVEWLCLGSSGQESLLCPVSLRLELWSSRHCSQICPFMACLEPHCKIKIKKTSNKIKLKILFSSLYYFLLTVRQRMVEWSVLGCDSLEVWSMESFSCLFICFFPFSSCNSLKCLFLLDEMPMFSVEGTLKPSLKLFALCVTWGSQPSIKLQMLLGVSSICWISLGLKDEFVTVVLEFPCPLFSLQFKISNQDCSFDKSNYTLSKKKKKTYLTDEVSLWNSELLKLLVLSCSESEESEVCVPLSEVSLSSPESLRLTTTGGGLGGTGTSNTDSSES